MDARDDRPTALDFATLDAHHRITDAICVREAVDTQIHVRAATVADEVLSGVPQLALERTAIDLYTWPRLDADS